MGKKVFISYCGKDGLPLGIELKNILEEDGHSAYLEKHDMQHGALIWDTISTVIEKGDAVIFIITPNSISSRGQKMEIEYTIHYGRPPVTMIQNGANNLPALNAFKYGHFQHNKFAERMKELSSSLDESINRHNKLFAVAQFQETPVIKEETAAEDIRFKGLDMDIVEKYLNDLKNGYFRSTMIRRISSIVEYSQISDDEKPFFQIGHKTRVPPEWFSKEDQYDSSMVFYEFGQSVSHGERNFYRHHLLEQIENNINKVSEKDVNFLLIKEHALSMKDKGFTPNVLLAPIKYFTQMAGWFDEERKAPCIDWKPERGLIINGEISLKLYWSNIYAPLNEFIIIDSDSSLWTLKPDPTTGEAITAHIQRSKLYPDEVEVFIKTVAKLTLKNLEGVRVILPQ